MSDQKRRGYGDGGVSPYETQDGERYSIVFRAFDPKRGETRQFRERGFKSRREAQTALRQRVTDAEAGQHVAPDAETLADWVERWLVAEKTQVRASTWSSYARNLRLHVVPAPPASGCSSGGLPTCPGCTHACSRTAEPTTLPARACRPGRSSMCTPSCASACSPRSARRG